MRRKVDNADATVAGIAAKQHGIVTLTQLIRAGLSEAGVRRRVAAGHLHRIHRAVYAVGHPGLSDEGRWMAAVLACGEGAALSHRPAAELLKGAQITVRARIRVTTPARTLADLKRAVAPRDHRRAVRQAEYLGLKSRSRSLRVHRDVDLRLGQPLGDIGTDGLPRCAA